jgi:hypothetical protein
LHLYLKQNYNEDKKLAMTPVIQENEINQQKMMNQNPEITKIHSLTFQSG